MSTNIETAARTDPATGWDKSRTASAFGTQNAITMSSVATVVMATDHAWLPGRLDVVCTRRLQKLDTFEGDPEAGYEKPKRSAAAAVRDLLSAIYAWAPSLDSPSISPSPEGEILVSWRRPGAYLVLHFDEGADFDWSFRLTKPLVGTGNAANPDMQLSLAKALMSFLDPTNFLTTATRGGAVVSTPSIEQIAHPKISSSTV